jgi:MFS family permease
MASQLSSIGAILLSTAFLLLGNGLTGTLTPARAQLDGFSHFALGGLGSAYYAGFVFGCFVVPKLLARVGHIRIYAIAAALTAATVLLQPIFTQPLVWFLIRAAFGVCAAGVYMVIESWLNDRATNETRGRILSAYIVVNLVSLMLGQWVLIAAPLTGYELFSLAAIIYILSVVPVGLTQLPQPVVNEAPRLRIRKLMTVSPVGMAGVITVGLANGAFWTLAPGYAISLGYSTVGLAFFMSVFILGGALIQLPLGRYSDRLDRRWIIVGVCAAAAAGGLALAILGERGAQIPWLLYPLSFVFGAAMLPLYSLSIAHANDRIARTEFVEASVTLLMVNGIASVVGPAIAGFVTEYAGLASLFYYTACIHVLMAAFTILRITAKRAETTREHFVALPQQSTPGEAELDPRSPEQGQSQAA